MSKRKFILTVSSFFLLTVFILSFIGQRERKLIKEGNKIVEEVEKFKEDNGRVPNSLSEIGYQENMEGPLYYEKRDSVNYVLWFGTSLGESVTYSSTLKEWH